MRVDYRKEIVESPEELSELEKSLRAKRAWPRARMLWLLKTGTVATVVDCAILLGYTWNQLQRWWKTYKETGLDGLLEVRSPPGRPSSITADAMEDLKEKMERGEISTLAKTREYLNSIIKFFEPVTKWGWRPSQQVKLRGSFLRAPSRQYKLAGRRS